MKTSIFTWNSLPDEIQREIASHLELKSLCFFAATSKRSLKNALPYLLQYQQTLLTSPYLSIVTGCSNSTFLSDASSGLYACGNNAYGQLGLGHNRDCNTFTLIQHLPKAVKSRWSLYRHIQQLRAIEVSPVSTGVSFLASPK